MKKLILISFFTLIALGVFSQTETPTLQVRVATATTDFTNNISVGTQVYDVANDLLYNCITATASGADLTSASANFSVVGAAISTGDLTESTSNILTITGGTDAVVGAGTSIQVKQASGSQDGFLSSTDWTTFNNKDGSITNEGSLSVGAGAANTSLIQSNTSGSADITISGSTYLNVTEAGNTITLTPTGLEPTVSKGDLTEATSDHIDITGGTGAVIGSGTSIQVKTGIADNKLLEVDDAGAADDQYARFTANGIEGRTATEVKTDLAIGTTITDKFEEDDGTPTAHSLSQTLLGGEANALVMINGVALGTGQFVLTATTLTLSVTVYQYDRVTITYTYVN
ncbi:MAG: hypothetical protein K8S00_12175 [Bacteroidales bacterium]|nr:hypothetical protein [Bacteroidales bacterium]